MQNRAMSNNQELAILINFDNSSYDNNILEYNHIQILTNQLIDIPHNNVSYYCFNQNQLDLTRKNKWNIFLSYIGNDLYNFNKDIIYEELFWFPSYDNIHSHEQELGNITKFLNNINQPICIAYNSKIQTNINPEDFRLFLIKIYKNFKNPLFKKELELIEHEEYSNSNHIFIHTKDSFIKLNAVLGLYGDIGIDSEFDKTNLKSILKNTECKSCEYNNNCIQRGLGYIINKMDYKGCIGINLLKN